jgi:hypothetical protein
MAMSTRIVSCGLALAALVVALAGPANAQERKEDAAKAKAIAGKYDVAGKNPGGEDYAGTCTIEHVKGNVVTLTWKVGKRSDVGRGEVSGDTVAVTYEGALRDKRAGSATFTVTKEGKLEGTWKDAKSGQGSETMTPAKK